MSISWQKTNRIFFDNFRSEVCHILKSAGDAEFVSIVVSEKWVETFWKWNWKEESLYTLALLDYLSDLYDVTPYSAYDWYRKQKLDETLFPQSIMIEDRLKPERKIKEKVVEDCRNNYCSSFFIKYNIVEGDIRNVA